MSKKKKRREAALRKAGYADKWMDTKNELTMLDDIFIAGNPKTHPGRIYSVEIRRIKTTRVPR
jgi:hypothetical protein